MNNRVFHPMQIAAHLVELVANVSSCDAVELAQGCIGFREQCIETAVGEIGVSMAKLEDAPFRLAHPAPLGRVARVFERCRATAGSCRANRWPRPSHAT